MYTCVIIFTTLPVGNTCLVHTSVYLWLEISKNIASINPKSVQVSILKRCFPIQMISHIVETRHCSVILPPKRSSHMPSLSSAATIGKPLINYCQQQQGDYITSTCGLTYSCYWRNYLSDYTCYCHHISHTYSSHH